MITLGEFIQIVIQMRWLGQRVANVWTYRVMGLNAPTDAVSMGFGYWEAIRVAYRAIAPSFLTDAFQSIRVRSLSNPDGAVGEYAIPAAEQSGTRSVAGEGSQSMPPFAACGVRLAVATRTTRPGQKRIPFLTEGDQAAGVIQPAFLGLVNTLLNIQEGEVTITPEAGNQVLLRSVIARLDASWGVTANQNTAGFLVSSIVTTQNTRKIGRGV